MVSEHSPYQNRLLAALPAEDFARIAGSLELVPLALGAALYESGTTMRPVYFPTDAIVSLLYVMEDGPSAEIAVVGNEGIVGVSLFMGGETTPSRAVVQSAGHAYRLPGQLLRAEFARAGPMQHLLLRYTQALLTQMAQTAVCNRHHSRRTCKLIRDRCSRMIRLVVAQASRLFERAGRPCHNAPGLRTPCARRCIIFNKAGRLRRLRTFAASKTGRFTLTWRRRCSQGRRLT